MATETLKRIWLLNQIDKSEISTTKLAILLTSVGITFGLVVTGIVGEVDVHPDISTRFPPELIARSFVWVPAIAGLTLSGVLAMCRSTESDIKALVELDIDMSVYTQYLRPPAWVLIIAITVISSLVLLSFPLGTAFHLEISFTEAVDRINSSDVAFIVLAYPLQLLYAIPMGIFGYVFVAQVRTLKRIAREIRIDMFRVDGYAALANPFVRLSLFWIVGFALWPIGMLFIGTFDGDALLVILVYLLVTTLPVFIDYSRPILIAKARIVERKQSEIAAILEYLKGNDDAIRQTSLRDRANNVTTADVLAHQMFIESRQEWPIAPFVRRLVTFGLLPPITWIVSTYLENYFL